MEIYLTNKLRHYSSLTFLKFFEKEKLRKWNDKTNNLLFLSISISYLKGWYVFQLGVDIFSLTMSVHDDDDQNNDIVWTLF